MKVSRGGHKLVERHTLFGHVVEADWTQASCRAAIEEIAPMLAVERGNEFSEGKKAERTEKRKKEFSETPPEENSSP